MTQMQNIKYRFLSVYITRQKKKNFLTSDAQVHSYALSEWVKKVPKKEQIGQY
jgi:hypothetical protein